MGLTAIFNGQTYLANGEKNIFCCECNSNTILEMDRVYYTFICKCGHPFKVDDVVANHNHDNYYSARQKLKRDIRRFCFSPTGRSYTPKWIDPVRPSKNEYQFHMSHADMLDVEKVQSELSMDRPLAILEWNGKVIYVFAKEIIRKGQALGILSVDIDEEIWLEDHSQTQDIIDDMRHIVNAPWPDKPDDTTCKVRLIEL